MGLFLLIAAIAIFLGVSRNALAQLFAAPAQTGRGSITTERRHLLDLAKRRRVALTTLLDLEHDFETGKLGESDYLHLREKGREEALRVLRAIDEEGDKLRYKCTIARDLDGFGERQRPSRWEGG